MEIYTNPEGVAWLEAAPHPGAEYEDEEWTDRDRYYEDHGLPTPELISQHDLIEETDLGIGARGTDGPLNEGEWIIQYWHVDTGDAFKYQANGPHSHYFARWGQRADGSMSDDNLGPAYSQEYADRHQLRERSLVSKD